ncbi:MAG: hypothetical protein EXR83_03865 [Gammaproteobacteria bacterium]|nr:hypothetical protein [Gammaproteobacteria bacterium]
MATLSTPGIGSGLDIRGIVEKLMSLETAPLNKLSLQIVEKKTQLSAFGMLKAAVSNFRDALDKLADLSKFKVYSATPSDPTLLSASATSAASRGTYNIDVRRLAETHRMAASITYADTDTTAIGTAGDTLTLTAGSSSFTVDTGAKTLAGIRDAINQARDNTGATASIFKDDTGYHLSLAANTTGSDGALGVSYVGSDAFGLTTLNSDRDSSGSFTSMDLNAVVTLETNFTITSSSNTISDSVEGVSMNLLKVGALTLKIDRDTASVQNTVQGFAKSYSDVIALMNKMRTDVLKNDPSALNNIESQMRATLNQPATVEGSFSNAFEVGISTLKNGSLAVNAAMLTSAMHNDYEGFAKLFADPVHGVAHRLRALADGFLGTGAVLDARGEGLQRQIKSQEGQKKRLQLRLAATQDRLTKQYNKLDSVIASLQTTGSALIAQLNAMTAWTQQRN